MHRPSHPDLDSLSSVVSEYLTPRPGEKADDRLRESLELLADSKSASYVAIQRAIGFLEIKGPDELQERYQEVFRLSIFWLDGFIAGGHLERSRSEGESGEDASDA